MDERKRSSKEGGREREECIGVEKGTGIIISKFKDKTRRAQTKSQYRYRETLDGLTKRMMDVKR